MFGIIVAGRLVQTEFERVGETQFVFNITDAEQINHFVAFMTGAQAFPDGYGGAVYFSMPSPDGQQTWHLIGHLTNQKPSAIFKVAGLKRAGAASTNPFANAQSVQVHWAQVGISVEPLSNLTEQVPESNAVASNVANMVEFTQKMLENFVNFATSFNVERSQFKESETYIPSTALTQWYSNFQRKMQFNPNFWKS